MPSEDDVEEFAALLRRLKENSDRSYAALARRLNMNASTLHRYCSGEAVPLGFAPVERFAALCGASPAERVELHRLWILAVAARQRSRTTPATEPAPPDRPDPSAALPLRTGQDPSDGPSLRTGQDPSEDPSPQTGQDPSEDPSPQTGRNAPEDPSDTGLASTPGELATEGAPGSASERPRGSRAPWYRRRVAVAAAVVSALLATLGALSALPPGRSTADAAHTGEAGDRVSGTPTARGPGARRGSASPSASPSVPHGRGSGTPAPGASASGEVSPGPSTSPSPAAGSGVTPIAWTVDSQLWATGCDHDYVIDKAPSEVPPPPAPQDAAPWARTQNAVHGAQTLMDVTVQGRTDTAVVLEALRVRVVGRSAPLKGTDYFTGQGCGGDLAPGTFKVDLDRNRPIARPVASLEGGTTPARHLPYRVSAADPEVLTIDAQTEGCDCRWFLELDWSSQGRTGTVRIDDHGRPFRTTGIKGLPRYWYTNGGWARTSG
ncbi:MULTISPECIES: helix-turn-helix domain-containing protein [unclassified Streptomyces]|uniref:helix-turn-helix domain-containing protein n=1 Tax=unclassified Streptomyces TaxID=2593676 RepID=UPI00343D046F